MRKVGLINCSKVNRGSNRLCCDSANILHTFDGALDSMEGGCGDRVVGCTVGCSEVGDGEVGTALASTVGDWKGCRVGLPLGEPLGWLLGGRVHVWHPPTSF